jgi:hypothetical protein
MSLPPVFMTWLAPFRCCFQERTWQRILVLVVGTLLARGRRTVTAALRHMGQQDDPHFSSYHQVFNRASWSLAQASHILFSLLLRAFCAQEPRLVIALDETLERRWGPKIRLTDLYHDAVRSTKRFTYCTHGLRWLVAALVVEVPWTKQRWALPFLIHFAPSPAISQQMGRRHKTVPERAGKIAALLRRWCPDRPLVLVGDGAYSVLDLGLTCRRHQVTLVAPLRLDACVFVPPPPRRPRQEGRPRIVGAKLPTGEQLLADEQTTWQAAKLRWYDGTLQTLEWVSGTGLWYRGGQPPLPIRYVVTRDPVGKRKPKAYFCTDPDMEPLDVLGCFLRRWPIEVTFEEARAHLGIQTQRQWSDRAILRETPCLFGLYSLVALWGLALYREDQVCLHQAAWYRKTSATFGDLLFAVRAQLWKAQGFCASAAHPDRVKIPPDLLSRLMWSACASP